MFSRSKKLQDLSASALQVLVNQLLGLFIFYVASAFLSKAELGEMNWAIAVVTIVLAILSFGMDQVVVKQIAAGDNPRSLVKMQLFHNVVTAALLLSILLLLKKVNPSALFAHPYLLGFAISLSISYFASPYKQAANGLEKFSQLAAMSTVANIMRGGLLIIVLWLFRFDVQSIIVIYIISSVCEWLTCALVIKNTLRRHPPVSLNWSSYFKMLKTSLPQLGVVIFNAAVARFDWILMGVLSTAVATADYTFAYKILELGTLPLLVLSFVLLPRLTRVIKNKSAAHTHLEKDLELMVRFEMALALAIVLVLNLTWIPLMEAITNGKYGTANANIFFILSLSLPFLYLINYCWTIAFVRGHLTKIMVITIIAFTVNVVFDLLLIKTWSGEGAAVAYLIAVGTQFLMYRYTVRMDVYRPSLFPLIQGLCSFLLAYFASSFVSNNLLLQLVVGIAVYIGALFSFGLVRTTDYAALKQTMFTS